MPTWSARTCSKDSVLRVPGPTTSLRGSAPLRREGREVRARRCCRTQGVPSKAQPGKPGRAGTETTKTIGWRPMKGTLDPGIFKAYDVRGLYGEQIDGDVAEQGGRAFVRVPGPL